MAKFKKGQTVYMGRGEHLQELVVAKVHKNPLLPIHQYTFEGHNFACGEQSIRATKDGRDLTLKECFVNDKEMEFRINTLASASKRKLNEEDAEYGLPKLKLWDSVRVDFKPSLEMCEWLKEYANGRIIFHIDSGQGFLVGMLKRVKARATGIEKYFNKEKWVEWRMLRFPHEELNYNEILEGDLKDYVNLIKKAGDKALILFARPKDTKNLKLAITEFCGKSEIILIDRKVDFYTGVWEKLDHKGHSEDNEAVYSLK